MKRTVILLKIYLIVFLLLVACDDSSVNEPETPQNNFEILSSSGKALNMHGEWNADCTPVGNAFLKESFFFSGDSLIIIIENFGLSDYSGTPFRTDVINITYEPKGTFKSV